MNSSFCARRSTRQICQKSDDQFDIDVILEFFHLQGCEAIWLQLLNDSSYEQYLAMVGDACLRLFVVKELALRGVQTPGKLQRASERYLNNSQLALLDSKLHISAALVTARHCTLSKRTVATTVEALIGAGESFWSPHTKGGAQSHAPNR